MAGLYGCCAARSTTASRGKQEPGAIAQQMYEIGNGSVLFVTVTMSVVGMIMVFQAGLQTQKVRARLSLLGANFIQILVREFAPTVCALMLATRVGAGIAAEIGSMVVTEQVDALRMCAADPIEYLVVPRFIACIVMTMVLGVLGAGHGARRPARSRRTSRSTCRSSTFVNFSLVKVGDFVVCLHQGSRLRRGDPDRQRLPRPDHLRRLRGRGLGDDQRRGAQLARHHHARLHPERARLHRLSPLTLRFADAHSLPEPAQVVRRASTCCAASTSTCTTASASSSSARRGVGKSVLIKHLVGLLRPDAGEICLDGEEISRLSEKRLLPGAQEVRDGVPALDAVRLDDLRENVALPLRKHKRLEPERGAACEADERLEQVHMRGVRRSLSRPSSATACASASPSRARSRSTRDTCSSTSPPPRSTR